MKCLRVAGSEWVMCIHNNAKAHAMRRTNEQKYANI